MKKTLKKLQPALLVVLLAFTCCQQDDVHMNDNNTSAKGNSRMITYEELKAMPKAISMLESLKEQRRKKSVYNERYDFTVDTTEIFLVEIGDYHSLTFTISRDSAYTDVTENLVLNWEPYEDYKTYMAEYMLTEEEKEKIADGEYVDTKDKERLLVLPEFSPSTILKSAGGAGEDQIIMVDGICYKGMWVRDESYSGIPGQIEKSKFKWVYLPVPCPEGHLDPSYTEGNHPGGGGPTNMPIFNTPYPISQEPITNMPGPGGYNGGTGNSGSPYNPIYTKPRVEIAIAHPRECKKIKDALDSNNFRQEVVDLAGKVNDPVNEYGAGLDRFGNVIPFPPGPEIQVPIPFGTPSFPNGYIVVSHTHNNSIAGTLSVFSIYDLRNIAQFLFDNHINDGTFVATLSTAKGTHYALTINNVTKFKDFFFYLSGSTNPADAQKILISAKNATSISKKYFENTTGNAIISESDTNNMNVLRGFLEFLNEANMGVSLFKTQANFQNFEQVSLKRDGSIQFSTCP
ncbi:hypothetical protein E0W68_00285 [Flavobacterium salilacus subsp. salilacus]|uniref:hypothetical protein n=1 Tax=Flavobacterium TaxID=237 RepID=UPI001075316C|nr:MULTISPECIES: hypothetical protein [Flavobacterium]KAF2519709.1 hypothetical protein E0W68_00285 [Flavobacterium salilacus subsp. salilacus]MBE1614402.1 hypothetical protein [Flavobacterium sp. SaA2.13]